MEQDRTAGQIPAPTPLTPAQEVGAGLKATRISRGYSLESVCQHTRIPRRFLEALETGRFEDLPAPVYLRSFLTGYCEYLELDLRPLWDKLHPAPVADAAAPAQPHPTPAQPKPAHEPAATPPQGSPYFDAFASAKGAVALSLALALALAWWAARGRSAGPASEESLRPQALRPARSAIEPKLALICRQETWISVKADGAVLFAGRLPKNARQQFQAHKLLLLRVSAPEDLTLTLNGAAYRLPRPDVTGEYRIESP
jgi:hypothetical protein